MDVKNEAKYDFVSVNNVDDRSRLFNYLKGKGYRLINEAMANDSRFAVVAIEKYGNYIGYAGVAVMAYEVKHGAIVYSLDDYLNKGEA